MAGTVLDELVVRLGAEIDLSKFRQFETRLNRVQQKMRSVGDAAIRVGGVLTAPLVLAGKTIFDFEVAMNQLQATLGVTDEKMSSLRDQAKELGRTTQFSASQVADAQNQLAQSGFSVNEILASTPDVLNLAAAGQLSMAEAAKLTANQLRAFGLDVSDADRVTDVLAATATKTNTSVRELGPAFRQVAPIAANLGLEIEDTAAAIGLLRDRGFAAEQSGTALRAVMSRLTNVSGEAEKVLKEIGLDPEFIENEMKAGRFRDVLGMLKDGGLDTGQAMQLFGQEAGAAGLVLVNHHMDYERMVTDLENVEGAAQRMAETQNKGVVGAIRNLRSALEGLQIELGEAGLTGVIEKAADALTRLVNWFNNADPGVKRLAASALLAGPALLGVGVGLRIVAWALGPVGKAIALIGPGIRAIGPAIRFALRFVPGLGLLITVATLIHAAWEPISTFFKGLGETIAEAFGEDVVTDIDEDGQVTRGAGRLRAAWDKLAAAFDKLISPFKPAIDGVSTAWNSLMSLFEGDATSEGRTVGGWIVTGLVALVDGVTDVINAWNRLTGLLEKPINGVFGWLEDAWRELRNMFAAPAGDDTGGGGEGLLDWILRVIPNPFGWLIDAWATVKDTVKEFPNPLAWVSEKVAAPFQWLTDGWNALSFPELDVAWPKKRAALFGWITEQWDALSFPELTLALPEPIAGIFDWLSAEFQKTLDAMLSIMPTWAKRLLGIEVPGESAHAEHLRSSRADRESGDGLTGSVADGIARGQHKIEGAWNSVAGWLRDRMPGSDAKEGPLSDIRASGRALVETFAEGVTDAGGLRAALLAGLPVAPAALPIGGAGAGAGDGPGGGMTLTMTFGEGAIQIVAQGGDAREIAGQIAQELGSAMRAGVEQLDSQKIA